MGLLSSFKQICATLLDATMSIHDDDDVDVPRDKSLDNDVAVSCGKARGDEGDVSSDWGDSEDVVRFPEHFIQRPAKW